MYYAKNLGDPPYTPVPSAPAPSTPAQPRQTATGSSTAAKPASAPVYMQPKAPAVVTPPATLPYVPAPAPVQTAQAKNDALMVSLLKDAHKQPVLTAQRVAPSKEAIAEDRDYLEKFKDALDFGRDNLALNVVGAAKRPHKAAGKIAHKVIFEGSTGAFKTALHSPYADSASDAIEIGFETTKGKELIGRVGERVGSAASPYVSSATKAAPWMGRAGSLAARIAGSIADVAKTPAILWIAGAVDSIRTAKAWAAANDAQIESEKNIRMDAARTKLNLSRQTPSAQRELAQRRESREDLGRVQREYSDVNRKIEAADQRIQDLENIRGGGAQQRSALDQAYRDRLGLVQQRIKTQKTLDKWGEAVTLKGFTPEEQADLDKITGALAIGIFGIYFIQAFRKRGKK